MRTYETEIQVKGQPVKVPGITVGGHELVVTGKPVRIARVKEEWDDGVDDPEAMVRDLKHGGAPADLVTFMQRLPQSRPKHAYFMEWDNVAALPISTYENWVDRQLHPNHRNKVKKAKKEGLDIRHVECDDAFITAVMRILNEVPVRQGGAFLDYGKDFDTVKREHVTYRDRSDFIGAYCGDELVGYLKLVFAGPFMRTMQILSMIKHRNKAPTNALMAEAVRICASRAIPYLVYGKYNYGKAGSDTLREFKAFNGFEHVVLPRYYVPLTARGALALKAGMHHGLKGAIPRPVVRMLLEARRRWYAKRQSEESRIGHAPTPVAQRTEP